MDEAKFIQNSSFRGKQPYNNHIYEFGHIVMPSL
jgi:hypothetical protein